MIKKYKKIIAKIIVVLYCCTLNTSTASEYPSLYDAINSTVTPRTYTLDATEIMTTTLGTFSSDKGFGNRNGAETLTIDGGVVGYDIMLEECTQNIASALRNAILKMDHIPEFVYQDNGRAFKSKFFNGDKKFDSGTVQRVFIAKKMSAFFFNIF